MQPKRIIIVEDEGIVAMDISKCLSGMGYEVVFIADTGEKLLEKIQTDPADLVLMDVELKGSLNGLETAKQVKQLHNIPVVFLTAFEDDKTLAKITDISNDGYLIKPFEDDNLKKIIDKVLQ